MMASCMVGFQPFHCVFFFSPHLANMCNTFTVHHKANRLVTQRHIVKTDVWLSWASRGVSFTDFWSIYQLNIRRSDKSDSKITFVSGSSRSLKRLTANGEVIVLADCLHLVDWGGTGASGKKLPWGKTAPGHRELGSTTSSANLTIHHPDSNYKLWLTQATIFTLRL